MGKADRNMIVQCMLCGDKKYYGQKNKRRCPYRHTHDWVAVWVKDGDIQIGDNNMDEFEIKLSESKRGGWKEQISKTGEKDFKEQLDKIIESHGFNVRGSYRASYMINGGYGRNPETGMTLKITFTGELGSLYGILKIPTDKKVDNANIGVF